MTFGKNPFFNFEKLPPSAILAVNKASIAVAEKDDIELLLGIHIRYTELQVKVCDTFLNLATLFSLFLHLHKKISRLTSTTWKKDVRLLMPTLL